MTDPTIFGHVNLSFSRGRAVVTQLQENGRYAGGSDESLMLEQLQVQ